MSKLNKFTYKSLATVPGIGLPCQSKVLCDLITMDFPPSTKKMSLLFLEVVLNNNLYPS